MKILDWLKRVAGADGSGKGKATLSAKVIRKDGTVEDLGVISESDWDPMEVRNDG